MSGIVAGVIAVVLCLGAVTAEASDLSIKAFFGLWRGNAVSESEISSNFRVTARDLDVEVRPFQDDGFSLRWATLQRQAGSPDKPAEVLKQTLVNFRPDPGRPGVWISAGEEDPLVGEPLYWSRIDGQTLVTFIFGLDNRGIAELQVYRRTLTGNGMELEFARSVDGQAIRGARGRLTKFSN